MSTADLQDLRRVVLAMTRLQGETVKHVKVRSDVRHVKVEFDSGLILLISSERDAQGRPRLEVDVVEAMQAVALKQQIEVRFD
ncbi:MAG: hypothetical protein ABR537_14325 [Gemmatimonadales bacterium]